jgi:hypothetical protein
VVLGGNELATLLSSLGIGITDPDDTGPTTEVRTKMIEEVA